MRLLIGRRYCDINIFELSVKFAIEKKRVVGQKHQVIMLQRINILLLFLCRKRPMIFLFFFLYFHAVDRTSNAGKT